MKKIVTALFIFGLPMAANAMCMHGGGRGYGSWHASGAFYAALAVIGYWVLHHAVKETVNCVKRAGQVLGWVLLVLGLLGLVWGIGGRIKTLRHHRICPESMMQQNAPEMPAMPEMGKMPGMGKPEAPHKKI